MILSKKYLFYSNPFQVLNNYLTYGFLLKPILMLGTFAAPFLFIVLGAIGTAGVVVGEIKRVIRDFIT